MFKPTRVRYKRTNNKLISQAFLNNKLENIQVEIDLDNNSINILNEQGDVIFSTVLANAKLSTLKINAKKLLVDAGVSFFEEARIRKVH